MNIGAGVGTGAELLDTAELVTAGADEDMLLVDVEVELVCAGAGAGLTIVAVTC